MSCLTAAERARILAQIAIKTAQLEAANATYAEMLLDASEQYKFDSAEGAQSLKNRSLEAMETAIDRLERQLAALRAKLACKGLVNMRLRRI